MASHYTSLTMDLLVVKTGVYPIHNTLQCRGSQLVTSKLAR
jgi:hypothetical protein